jgi:hypothetical protein
MEFLPRVVKFLRVCGAKYRELTRPLGKVYEHSDEYKYVHTLLTQMPQVFDALNVSRSDSVLNEFCTVVQLFCDTNMFIPEKLRLIANEYLYVS